MYAKEHLTQRGRIRGYAWILFWLSFIGYLVFFPVVHHNAEGGETALSLVWVGLVGWFLGPHLGAGAGILNIPLHFFLNSRVHDPFTLSQFVLGEPPGLIITLAAGVVAGWVRRLLDVARAQNTELAEVHRELHLALAQLETLIRSGPVVMFRREGPEFRLTYISPNAERILGYQPEELLGGVPSEQAQHIHPEDRDAFRRATARLLEAGEVALTYRLRHAKGQYRWFYSEGRLIDQEEDEKPVLLGYLLDVTDQVEANQSLRRLVEQHVALFDLATLAVDSNELTRLFQKTISVIQRVLQASHTAIGRYDPRDELLVMEEGTGLSARGQTKPTLSVSESEIGRAFSSGKTVSLSDLCQAEASGLDSIWCDADVKAAVLAPIPGEGRPWGVLIVGYRHPKTFGPNEMTFIETVASVLGSAIRKLTYAERIQNLAFHDPLTGLGNRRVLEVEAPKILALARRQRFPVALLFLDLDNFGEVNNALGHEVGDEVLRTVANRLRQATRESDVLARVGGDEFILLLPNAGRREAERVAERINELLEIPFTNGRHRFSLHASVGIALFPSHGSDLEELIRKADAAMYRAKGEGEPFCIFDPREALPSPERLDLASALREAIHRNELVLHYQPILDMRKNDLVRVEALLRWTHPRRGNISPNVFIPLAEKTRLITEIDRYALEKAIRQAALWHREGLRIGIAVNLSPPSFWKLDLPELLMQLLQRYGLPPDLLTLEITERVLANPHHAAPVLRELRELGVKIAVDDFGTDYSSLRYLRELPLDELKIDKGFVREIGSHLASEAIARTITTLAHELGLKALAEGVETEHQLSWCKREGCDLAQGYFIGKPMSPASIVQLVQDLERQSSGPSA